MKVLSSLKVTPKVKSWLLDISLRLVLDHTYVLCCIYSKYSHIGLCLLHNAMLDVFGPSANAVLAISKMSEDSHPKYNLKQSQKKSKHVFATKGSKTFFDWDRFKGVPGNVLWIVFRKEEDTDIFLILLEMPENSKSFVFMQKHWSIPTGLPHLLLCLYEHCNRHEIQEFKCC